MNTGFSRTGLLPLRTFDQRYGLTRGLAKRVCNHRDDPRVSHSRAGASSERRTFFARRSALT